MEILRICPAKLVLRLPHLSNHSTNLFSSKFEGHPCSSFLLLLHIQFMDRLFCLNLQKLPQISFCFHHHQAVTILDYCNSLFPRLWSSLWIRSHHVPVHNLPAASLLLFQINPNSLPCSTRICMIQPLLAFPISLSSKVTQNYLLGVYRVWHQRTAPFPLRVLGE